MAAVAGRLTRFEPGDEIRGGMRTLATPGHTPGHVSFELDGSGTLIIVGDVATSTVVSFEHPGWHFGVDPEPETVLRTQRTFLERIAAEKIDLRRCQWIHPGVGYAERNGSAYRFVAG